MAWRVTHLLATQPDAARGSIFLMSGNSSVRDAKASVVSLLDRHFTQSTEAGLSGVLISLLSPARAGARDDHESGLGVAAPGRRPS